MNSSTVTKLLWIIPLQELSSLPQDLSQDIDAVNRGLLPKLAKRLRKEIAQ